MFLIFLLFTILPTLDTTTLIERGNQKDNYVTRFKSTDEACRHTTCYSYAAGCAMYGSLPDCCFCVCTADFTFLSYSDGCVSQGYIYRSFNIKGFTAWQIQFVNHHGPRIPTLFNLQSFEQYMFNIYNIHNEDSCKAGPIYFVDNEGNMKSYHQNYCQVLLRVLTVISNGKEMLLFKWSEKYQSSWSKLAGQMMVFTVTCNKNTYPVFFQIFGSQTDSPAAIDTRSEEKKSNCMKKPVDKQNIIVIVLCVFGAVGLLIFIAKLYCFFKKNKKFRESVTLRLQRQPRAPDNDYVQESMIRKPTPNETNGDTSGDMVMVQVVYDEEGTAPRVVFSNSRR
ncbi:uncharacterized protein [Clytia hemisphaerica]|eukprot:TCONS_00062694-protein